MLQQQQTLPMPLSTFPTRKHCQPICRWVGSKRAMVNLLSDSAYRYLQCTGGRYIESFLGGGAVALDLGLPSMLLADLCGPLINCYEWTRKCPQELFANLERYRMKGTDKDTYYAVRQEAPLSRLHAAARFLYLNVVGYNGLWRVNRQGRMNVPYGRPVEGQEYKFPTLEMLELFGDAISTSELHCCDFERCISRARAGDLILCDPPYLGVYDAYTEYGFSTKDQSDLADHLRAARDRGVAILAMNNDLPEIHSLYSWATITRTQEARHVAADTTKRGKTGCVLITSPSDLLTTPSV